MPVAPTRRPAARPSLVTPSRIAAADIFAGMREGQLLDQAFDAHTTALDPRDRRWTRELVSGCLRERGRIDHWIGNRATGGIARLDADLTDLLRLGAYQLLFMDSVPPYAAIGQTVEVVKDRHGIGAGKLANAVLRRLDREREQLGDEVSALSGDPVDYLATRFSHPAWLVARYVARFGADATRELLAANNREAPLMIRPWSVSATALREAWAAAGIAAVPATADEDTLVLEGPASVPALPGFAEGRFFVQDVGATAVVRYAAIQAGTSVLDLCAAPGGKAFELARTASAVTAVDRSAPRVARLAENIARLQITNVQPRVGDALSVDLPATDVVLLDAPCTGTGTFRRHPDARWRLRISDLAVTAAMQGDLLASAARCVRPGGLLVYSTCSLEPEENDDQVTRFLAHHEDFVLEPPAPGRVPASMIDAGVLRVLPHVHGCDGAFAARLRRR